MKLTMIVIYQENSKKKDYLLDFLFLFRKKHI